MRMQRSSWLDLAGGLAGGLCAIHCAIVALLPGIISGSGLFFLGNTHLESALVGGALLMTGWAVITGLREHRHRGVLVLFVAAGVFMLLGLLGHEVWPGVIGTTLSMVGGVLLVGTHIYNAACKSSCRSCASATS